MTPSKALFYACITFIVGIATESITNIPQIFVWGIFVLGIIIVVATLLFKKNTALVAGFFMLALVLGVMRFQISEFTVANDVVSKLNDRPENITLKGEIINEPDIRDASQKLKVKIEKTKSVVLVTVARYPQYHYLDTIQMTGKLKTPAVFDDFNYKNYLAKDGIYSVMDYPNVELIFSTHTYNIFTFTYEKILWLKVKLMASLDAGFMPPDSDILKGVVFGNDKNLAKDIKDRFNATGLSHITAVSGTNIVILIEVLMIFLLAAGLWRGQAFYFAIILIWLYIIMIGLPVSGVRAAIMGSVGLLAQKLGRQNTSARVLTMTAGGMLLQNPMLLLYDVSFQLSFLASLGIIYVKPLIDYYVKMPMKFSSLQWAGGFLDILSVTFAAQIITLPIIVYNFGRLSLVAPITNLLVLPIVSLLTILGFLASMAGMFSTMLIWIFWVPCHFLLWYLLWVLNIFSGPWAATSISNISWVWVVIYYSIVIILIKLLQKYQKPKFLGY